MHGIRNFIHLLRDCIKGSELFVESSSALGDVEMKLMLLKSASFVLKHYLYGRRSESFTQASSFASNKLNLKFDGNSPTQKAAKTLCRIYMQILETFTLHFEAT